MRSERGHSVWKKVYSVQSRKGYIKSGKGLRPHRDRSLTVRIDTIQKSKLLTRGSSQIIKVPFNNVSMCSYMGAHVCATFEVGEPKWPIRRCCLIIKIISGHLSNCSNCTYGVADPTFREGTVLVNVEYKNAMHSRMCEQRFFSSF